MQFKFNIALKNVMCTFRRRIQKFVGSLRILNDDDTDDTTKWDGYSRPHRKSLENGYQYFKNEVVSK